MRRNFLLLLLAAMFTMISCEKNQQPREIDPFIQSLQGRWVTDTLVNYDKEWKEVELVLIENGWPYLEGISSDHYTFNADGTLTHSYFNPPNGWVDLWTLPCFYDKASKIISVKRDNGKTHCEYLVSSYDGECLVLDYTLRYQYDRFTDKYYYTYVRETLKRDPNWTMPQN